jgi:hypothetical protein
MPGDQGYLKENNAPLSAVIPMTQDLSKFKDHQYWNQLTKLIPIFYPLSTMYYSITQTYT